MPKLKFPKPIKRKKTLKRLRRIKLTPMATLERKTWTIFSMYIRLRDSAKCGSVGRDWVKCYTCGKDLLIKDAEAGHFIPRGKKILKFNEDNVHSQCCRCNRFLHGNLGVYALKLGMTLTGQLIAKSHEIHKFTREELEGIRRDCALKISKLI